MAPEEHGQIPCAYRLRGLVVAGVVWVLVGVSCGGHGERSSAGSTGSSRSPLADSLAVSLALDAGSYAVGERVQVSIIARNVTARTLKVTFPTAERADFIVRKGSKAIWQWGAGIVFAQTMEREAIAPWDSLVFGTQWNQVLPDGTNPKLGAYTIQGILKISPEIATKEKRFGIVD